MAKDDDKNLTVLENERLENELSLLQSKLTDSSSKLLQYQNVQDESATTKSELEEKKREITDSKEKNLRLTNDDSQLRREIEDRERLIASSQADMEELRVTLNNQTDTNEKLLDQMSSLTPRNGEEVGIKVEKPNEMPVIKQFETIQNNPESLNFPTWEAILTIESLSDEIPTENQELDEAPEEPVSEPKDIPVKVRPSNQQLEMDEKKPEQEILLEIIDDTGNMTNKDPVLGETKRTELLEMAEETIIPEESEHVEKQPTNAQSNKSTDNQFLHKPGDGQVQPQIPEKSQLLQNRAMDEKPEATELFFDCKEENRKPQNFQIKVVRGVDFPKAKNSNKYYVSMQVEDLHGLIRDQVKKMKTKIIRGSQPEWNQNFTIETQNPEKWMLTIKLKKSSIFGLKTSTVGFVELDVSSLENGLNKLQLYDKSYNPVGKACLEVEIEYLPEVIPSPEIVSKPKETLAEVPPSTGHELETKEKKPEAESLNDNLQKTIDDTGNVTNKDPVLGETEPLEIAKETIIPEKNEQVEKQPSKAQSNRSIDNQFRHKPGDRHALPPNTEKSQLLHDRATDEKREAPEPHHDCEKGNRKNYREIQIRVIGGVNLPEAKENYYVSMQVDVWYGMIHFQSRNFKTKTIRGSQPQWNKQYTSTITEHPEKWMLTMKLKKSSILGLKTSTVGFVKLDMCSLENGLNKMQLYDETHNSVGKACLEVEIEYMLPEVIPSPEIVCKPKETLAEVPPSTGHELETKEKKPEAESLNENLQKTIDDTGNVTNKDTVLGETELTEIAKETIIPEKNEQVEKQPPKAISNRSTDNQFRDKPIDRQLPPNPEKSVCEEGNQKPLKHFNVKVVRGVDFPKAKDSDKYNISMRVEQWHSLMSRDMVRKIKTKTIRGSQPEWNEDFTIKTRNPEECRMSIKVKKSSKLGLKTVGFVKVDLSSLDDGLNKLQLYDKFYNRVGEVCLEVEIPSPTEAKRQ
jgi:hypothetical protein